MHWGEAHPLYRLLRRGRRITSEVAGAATRGILGTITHVTTSDPVAAITFDDGPHPEYTPDVLEILRRYQARATFFMIGEAAQRHRTVVEQVAAAGHAIGNHSWNHPSFPMITARERREQILACQSALAPYAVKLFRPPYCQQSFASYIDVRKSGYEVVAFTGNANDWTGHDSGWMATRLLKQIRPGSIVILHDAIYLNGRSAPEQDRRPMLAALEMALQRLHNCFEFVTVPELLKRGRIVREHWWQKPAASVSAELARHPSVAKTLAGPRA